MAYRILGGVVEWDKTRELVIQHKLPFLLPWQDGVSGASTAEWHSVAEQSRFDGLAGDQAVGL